jgi:hypothetical protein
MAPHTAATSTLTAAAPRKYGDAAAGNALAVAGKPAPSDAATIMM